MIFEYDELKECVEEDFERFYKLGFNEKQIFRAVLNEYEHGEDFCQEENICIHFFLALSYLKKELNFKEIKEKLRQLMTEGFEKEIKAALGNDYIKFVTDLSIITDGGRSSRR